MTNHRKGEGERRGELAVMLSAVIAVIQQKLADKMSFQSITLNRDNSISETEEKKM